VEEWGVGGVRDDGADGVGVGAIGLVEGVEEGLGVVGGDGEEQAAGGLGVGEEWEGGVGGDFGRRGEGVEGAGVVRVE
jgi:hypothetical protein